MWNNKSMIDKIVKELLSENISFIDDRVHEVVLSKLIDVTDDCTKCSMYNDIMSMLRRSMIDN